jgi:hypothetical protein
VGRKRSFLPLIVVGLLGLAVLAIGLYQTAGTTAFVLHAERADARFAGAVSRVGGSHGGTFLHPTFAFTTRDGRSVRFTSSGGSTDQPYADGEHVAVLYDPDHPEQARLASFSTLWLIPVLIDAIGLSLIGIAVFVWWALGRNPRLRM